MLINRLDREATGGFCINANSIVISSAAVTAVILISYLFLYKAERKRFILVWCHALFMFFLAYLTRCLIGISNNGIYIVINNISTVSAYCLVYYGTCDFLQKNSIRLWRYVLIISLLVIIPVSLSNADLNKALILVSTFCSVMLFQLAILLYKCKSINASERIILVIAFTLWGMTVLLYPFYHFVNVLPVTLGYLLAGCSGLITAITIQGVYFRKLHESMLQKDEKLKYFGMYDKLTGVLNRAYFEQELARLDVAENLPLSIIVGDINGLKLINDTFGHSRGDELLIDTVNILRAPLKENDIIARMGGDEFIILKAKTGYQDAMKYIETIYKNCRSFQPKTIPIHISMGAASKYNADTSVNDVINLADNRMYDEKLFKRMNTRRTIIDFLQNVLLEKDYQTETHVMRMKELVTAMGSFLGGMTDKEIEELSLAAELHDIGKIAVPEEILKKPSKLSEEEWVLMKRHADIGYRITQSCTELTRISEYILSHHEWWNGRGYPRGLKGDEIPLYSRIISIVDAYDVMTHDRPYQEAKSASSALSEINDQAGKQFDPFLVKVFTEMMELKYGITCHEELNYTEMDAG